MKDSRAAVRYAKATLEYALEKKATEAVEKDMRQMLTALADNRDLADVVGSPVLKGAEKEKALLTVFKKSHEISRSLISLLVHNKRIDHVQAVAETYIRLHEKMKGEEIAYVTTAVPLTPALEKKILKQVTEMTDSKVSLKNEIDESIIGGFILRVGDLQYDASIANNLNSLKREFTNTQ